MPETAWLLAALAELLHESAAAAHGPQAGSPWQTLDGWRLNGRGRRIIALRHGETRQDVGVAGAAGGWELSLGDTRVFARGTLETNGQLHVQLGERRLHAAVVIAAERRHVFLEGRAWPLARVDNLYTGGEGDEAGGGLRAPMPGKIVALLAQAGATVAKGAPLLVMEAMKMEHTITAPADGTLKAFCYAPGDQVADGAELVEFEVTA